VHFYNWNIADYASHTGHLSPIEDIAYRRMLDLYYLHEEKLGRTAKVVARDIRMEAHEAEVRAVLAEFFDRTPDGYVNKRAEHEIARYREKCEKAANAGRTSAQRRLNGRSTNGQPTSTQEPRTSTTPTPPSGGVGSGPTSSEEQNSEPRLPVVELQQALLRTGLRSELPPFHRGVALMKLAAEVLPSGITPGDVDELWKLAQVGDDPGALLAHWLTENIWREVLDEQRAKAKQHEAAQRAKDSADPLEGVYGS
jgi:uncharacterized protein YdaU (DUF1376 family)